MNLQAIARALGGVVTGRQVLAPGPGHSKRDRSMSVWLHPASPWGFRTHSHCGDDWRDCVQHVCTKLGIERSRSDGGRLHQLQTRRRQDHCERADKAGNRVQDMARDLVRGSSDARGTIAERYLKYERRLGDCLDEFTALSLRFHPSCPFRDGDELVLAPALICVVRSARAVMGACQSLGDPDCVGLSVLRDVSHVRAVQRIRLDDKGRKVERRSLGPMGDDGCVFIGNPFESFYAAMATIAEGVETALAMRALGHEGCVALAGASRFRSFLPPFHWGAITISGERDDGASERAWRDAGPRWAAEGRDVSVWAPPSGFKDANDFVIARAQKGRLE